jgi:hypothetical protein
MGKNDGIPLPSRRGAVIDIYLQYRKAVFFNGL